MSDRNRLWNFWFGSEPAPEAAAMPAPFEMPTDVKAHIASLQSEAALLDGELAKIRKRKKEISEEIARIENAVLAARPPNPKGVMKIGAAVILLALSFFSVPVFAFDLSWTPGAPTASGTPGSGAVEEFRVLRRKTGEPAYTQITKTGPTVTTYSDPDRTPGNCYQVVAANFVGPAAPLEGCANIPPATTVIVLK